MQHEPIIQAVLEASRRRRCEYPIYETLEALMRGDDSRVSHLQPGVHPTARNIEVDGTAFCSSESRVSAIFQGAHHPAACGGNSSTKRRISPMCI